MKAFFLFLLSITFAQVSIFLNEIENQFISSQNIHLSRNPHLEGWYDDFSTAQVEALETKKPIFLAFLGPTWCKWSDNFEAEILTSDTFIKKTQKDLILAKVDLPEDFTNETNINLPSIRLAKRYKVDKCPCLLLIDPYGEKIAEIDNLPMKSDVYASYIKEMIGDFHQIAKVTEKKQIKKLQAIEIKELYRKAAKLADKHFRKVLLEVGVEKDKSAYFLIEKYSEIIAKKGLKNREIRKLRKKILQKDPKNEQSSQFKMAMMDFGSLSEVINTPQHPGSVIQPLVDYLKNFGKQDSHNAWKVEMMISEYLFGRDYIEDALIHAKDCLNIAPEAEKKEIEKSIQYLQTKLPTS